MRFSGVNSFVLACKELEKAGFNPVFKFLEVRNEFKKNHLIIATLDATLSYDEVTDVLSFIFTNNNGEFKLSFTFEGIKSENYKKIALPIEELEKWNLKETTSKQTQ